MTRRDAVLLAVLASFFAAQPAHADGMLDPSFGNGGLVTTDFGIFFPKDFAAALVMLPDGRAVAAGVTIDVAGNPARAVARYLTSGALDTSFSGDGLLILGGCSMGTNIGASDVLLQPDGRLVLIGSCPSPTSPSGVDFALARLNVNGTLDPSFGSGGQVFTPFATDAWAVSGLLQPDGRILAVGYLSDVTQAPMIAAARYNVDGTLDPTFGTAGQITLPLAQAFLVFEAALQPDGKLVIGGGYGPDFGLVRLLPGGGPDPSFDGDGLVTSDFGAPESGRSVIVLGDGRLVLAGDRGTVPNIDLALVRYLADGTLDTSFGTGGLATADAGGTDRSSELVELPNGKLVLAGRTGDRTASDFLLARFDPNGTLDTSFGMAGFIQTDFSTSDDVCTAVAIAGPDLILTAGAMTDQNPLVIDFALARYIATIPVELLTFEVE